MKKYKISQDVMPYIRKILLRRGIKYKIIREEEKVFCRCLMTNEEFHNIIIRARCEKRTKDEHSEFVYLAKKEVTSGKTRWILRELGLPEDTSCLVIP